MTNWEELHPVAREYETERREVAEWIYLFHSAHLIFPTELVRFFCPLKVLIIKVPICMFYVELKGKGRQPVIQTEM